MSKKSTGRCRSADSICSLGDARSSAKSSVSPPSTRGGGKSRRSTEEFLDPTSSSSNHPSASEDSPMRSSDESSDASNFYLRNFECIRRKFSEDEGVGGETLFAFLENDRWSSPTRKPHSTRILSSVRTLHIIEEKDEENSGETPTENAARSYDSENRRTPRFYEVPPKRLCTRPRTPKFDERLRLNLDDLSPKQLSSEASPFFGGSDFNLPSSVIDEEKPEMPPVEPKIIVLDSGRYARRKTKRKDRGRGDCFSDSDEAGVLKKYCEYTPEISTISTPAYTVSPMLTDRANQTDSCCCRNRIYSRTELEEVEIKTVGPEPDDDDFRKLDKKSLQSLKPLIVDFAEGVRVTRTFPDNFQDVRDDKTAPPCFKDKGTELLRAASNKSNQFSSPELSSYDATERDRNLIDARKIQVTDLDYYAMEATSSEDEGNRAGLEVEDILMDGREKSECCGCFGLISKLTLSSKR